MKGSVLALGLTVVADLAWAGNGGKVSWGTDYEAARTRAAESGRLLMIYFTTDPCGPCRRLDEGAFSDEAVVGKATAFETVIVDERKDRALVAKYGVKAYPLILFADPETETEVAQIARAFALDSACVVSEMDTVLKKFSPKAEEPLSVSERDAAHRWLDRLSADVFSEHEEAQKGLVALGRKAPRQVKALLAGAPDDPETQTRCEAIRRAIAPAAESATLGDTCPVHQE